MQRAISLITEKDENITLVHPKCNAAETKRIISRMAFFAGSRTHSTVAALSSGVPTLSFGYSIKAQGINRDIFGQTDYCLETKYLDVEAVVDRMSSMLDETTAIKCDLTERIPKVRREALNAGIVLRQLLGEN
jgi:colanic acid/amylovoran biosynthesis protein